VPRDLRHAPRFDNRRMQWDLYCRVVDNFGDVGVAWRLAADLARRGERVRLSIDDARPLAWMAPDGASGVQVTGLTDTAATPPDAIVELFGGGLPEAVKQAAAAKSPFPVVVNLEHLSAEPYVERSHGLPSPTSLPSGMTLTTWFFYPGFTRRTGGLLREQDLFERRKAFDPVAWLTSRGVDASGGRRVSLFCYTNEAIPELLQALMGEPTVLLLTPGPATEQASSRPDGGLAGAHLGAVSLPHLSQVDFDHLLWSCDLNFVRGEDSLVRALWAGVPFVWQLYPQADGAHVAKLEAFLDLFLSGAEPTLAAALRFLFRRWNGVDRSGRQLCLPAMSPGSPWRQHCAAWRDTLASGTDLTASLLEFVRSKR
jgi:uncharacterized repeat protein (TIGR03837 family)